MSRRTSAISFSVLLLLSASAVWWATRPAFGSGRSDVAELGKFNLDQISGVDADIAAATRQLDGRKITLLGEMFRPLHPHHERPGLANAKLAPPAGEFHGRES